MRALRGAGFWTRLGDAPKVLDAGMGDGRVVASLCAVGHHVQAYGIEIHHQLSELANENLHDLSERGLPKIWRTCDGSYLDRSTYAKLGIHVEDIDAFFNYPDGTSTSSQRSSRATLAAVHFSSCSLPITRFASKVSTTTKIFLSNAPLVRPGFTSRSTAREAPHREQRKTSAAKFLLILFTAVTVL